MSESDRRQVEAMAAYGIPETEIARVIGIDPRELRGQYPDELDTGSTRANSRVAENLYRRATGEGREAVTAAIFWLKTRAGWRERSVHELHGTDGPITVVIQRFSDGSVETPPDPQRLLPATDSEPGIDD